MERWHRVRECASALLRGTAGVAIGPLPSPRAPRDGWAPGLAVKSDSTDLAQALQAVVNQLAGGGRMAEIFARHNVPWRGA